MRAWMKELEELERQGPALAGDVPDGDGQEQRLQQRFLELLEPLERRRKELETAKAIYQLGRDLEDEKVRSSPWQALVCRGHPWVPHRAQQVLSPTAVGAGAAAPGKVDGTWYGPPECAAPDEEERGEPQRSGDTCHPGRFLGGSRGVGEPRRDHLPPCRRCRRSWMAMPPAWPRC